jgi:hypothetical protein
MFFDSGCLKIIIPKSLLIVLTCFKMASFFYMVHTD